MRFNVHDAARQNVIGEISITVDPQTLRPSGVELLWGPEDAGTDLLNAVQAGVPLYSFLYSHGNRFANPYAYEPRNIFDLTGAAVAGFSQSNGTLLAFDGRYWESVATDKRQLPPYSADLPDSGDDFVRAKVSAVMPPLSLCDGRWRLRDDDFDKHAAGDQVLVTAQPPREWLDSDADYADEDTIQDGD